MQNKILCLAQQVKYYQTKTTVIMENFQQISGSIQNIASTKHIEDNYSHQVDLLK
jgi:hypothetical protein